MQEEPELPAIPTIPQVTKTKEEKKKMQAELAERHAKEEAEANAIISKNEGKDKNVIIKLLQEAGIHEDMINKLLPEEKKESK